MDKETLFYYRHLDGKTFYYKEENYTAKIGMQVEDDNISVNSDETTATFVANYNIKIDNENVGENTHKNYTLMFVSNEIRIHNVDNNNTENNNADSLTLRIIEKMFDLEGNFMIYTVLNNVSNLIDTNECNTTDIMYNKENNSVTFKDREYLFARMNKY